MSTATAPEKSLKEVSVEALEQAIAKALTALLGTEYRATVNKLDFSHADMGGVIPLELSVSKVLQPGLFPGAI